VTRCAFAAVQFSEDWADARVDKESRRPKSNKEIISYHALGVINQEILARGVPYMHCTNRITHALYRIWA
jgi:hypothetical protein